MFTKLNQAEMDALRGKLASAMRDVLDEARELDSFHDARGTYGVDGSDYLKMLAEFATLELDTYPAEVAR